MTTGWSSHTGAKVWSISTCTVAAPLSASAAKPVFVVVALSKFPTEIGFVEEEISKMKTVESDAFVAFVTEATSVELETASA